MINMAGLRLVLGVVGMCGQPTNGPGGLRVFTGAGGGAGSAGV
jgi:hypothetical protein